MTMTMTAISPELAYRVDQLLTDYANCIDDERYEEWPSFFTEQCLYKLISRDNHRRGLSFGFIYCDNRRMLRDRITSMKSANVFEPHTYRHIVNRPVIQEMEDGVLAARSSYIVVRVMHDGAQELFSTGVYEDKIVEEDGRLLFKERTVVCDSSCVDALLVIPL